MIGAPKGLPLPSANRWSAPFWDACAQHRLVVQRCAACGTFRHPPGPLCANCRSSDFAWEESAGRGEVFTYTVAHHAVHPAVKEQVPYGVVVVRLDDCGGALLTSNVIDVPPSALYVGLRVKLAWDDIAEGVALPRFMIDA